MVRSAVNDTSSINWPLLAENADHRAQSERLLSRESPLIFHLLCITGYSGRPLSWLGVSDRPLAD